jgi:hypothetical protein
LRDLPDIFNCCTETTYLLVLVDAAAEAETEESFGGSDWASEASGKIRTVRKNGAVNLDTFMGTTLGGKVISRHRLYFEKEFEREMHRIEHCAGRDNCANEQGGLTVPKDRRKVGVLRYQEVAVVKADDAESRREGRVSFPLEPGASGGICAKGQRGCCSWESGTNSRHCAQKRAGGWGRYARVRS